MKRKVRDEAVDGKCGVRAQHYSFPCGFSSVFSALPVVPRQALSIYLSAADSNVHPRKPAMQSV
jgi:hypothetical protein